MARLSRLYPQGPIDMRPRVHPLPEGGSVPYMPGWNSLPTPGHGHVSFFRERNGLLLAGDAIVTTRQESAISVMTRHQELHGPPAYYTSDWSAARESVRRLADLQPSIAATGHGRPMSRPALQAQLAELAWHFDSLVLPRHDRYIYEPARADENGGDLDSAQTGGRPASPAGGGRLGSLDAPGPSQTPQGRGAARVLNTVNSFSNELWAQAMPGGGSG